MALDNLVVTPPPHLRGRERIAISMRDVLIALVPVTIAALVAFTYNALFNIALAIGACVFFEWAIRTIRKQKVTLNDGSALVTGLLLALLLPPKIHWLNIIIAAFIAIVVAKELMGGLGRNIFNPALFGFVFILIGSGFLASWTGHLGFLRGGFDGVTAATPLVYLKQGIESQGPSYLALLFGTHGGAISEVGAFWVMLGGAYLLYRKVISWVIPATILATVLILSYILGADGLYSILAGGLMLGAFFMATDWTTSPMTTSGQIVYGLIIGVSVVLIRLYGGPSGAVAYSILIGNAFVLLLDRVFRPKSFGEVVAA
jgi:H+/Na+-translocating ferredoxin:NAD+ oxidoreductase subunit D